MKFHPLTTAQVEKILTNAGFVFKRSRGSHFYWEGYIKGKRRIVTVDKLKSGDVYSPRGERLKCMIRQSGMTKKEFYSYLKD